MSTQTALMPVSAQTILRETLYTGPIVKVKVPRSAKHGSCQNDDVEISFLQYSHSVRGGLVNIFVHTDDLDVRGQTITASASVLQKTLEDGRQYLYVDLIPVGDMPITHRLVVMANIDESYNGCPIFRTPKPLEGVIVFTPPETKVLPIGKVVQLPKVPAKQSLTGDTQLDRLIDAGWKIESEDPKTRRVNLFKIKDDKRRTMVHHRSKASRK